MKESISYSFLLNIIILFITVCAAIIMGIFSYYKAFRANSIITETIEKYEGYNCLAKEEIARKLGGIGYNTPFNVTCNNDGNCETDNAENGNYKVVSYNLDFDEGTLLEYKEGETIKTSAARLAYDEPMNSSYVCFEGKGCTTNKHYQYGVYTYMYVELPVVSNLIRLSFFSKTKPMYEFRNFYVEQNDGNTRTTDVEASFANLFARNMYSDDEYFGTKTKKIPGMSYATDSYKGKLTITGFDEDGNPKTSTDLTATDVMANNILQAYLTFGTGDNKTYINWEDIFTDIKKINGVNLRQRAAIMSIISSNGGVIDASLSSSILGKGLPRNECGFVKDYSLLYKDTIY